MIVVMSSLIERKVPRKILFTPGVNPHAAGSVIAEFGRTKLYVTVSVEEFVPDWMRGRGRGWLSAEYNMLPGSTHTRSRRERHKVGGRTLEIQRLIGRSLRAILDGTKLGERTLSVDCDVLVADGGTRTTAISGGYVALCQAIQNLRAKNKLSESPIIGQLAALSVGLNSRGKVIADLNYQEDSQCQVDMNVAMTREGRFVEVQASAEGEPFSSEQFGAMIECAQEAMGEVFLAQDRALQ